MGERFVVRITIDDNEAVILIEAISKVTMRDYESLTKEELMALDRVSDKIGDEQRREVSPKKKEAAVRATQVRSDKARLKIEKALNMMRLENKPISVYLVAKEAGVSYNTANKYAHLIEPVL